MKYSFLTKIAALIVILLFTNINYSQNDPSPIDLPTVVPPSPTVGALMSFEEVPVSYYTGQPKISIPLYKKNIGFGLEIPISLDYSTTGVRINERSGWVGTGWSLDAGGVISRTVRGIPDEYYPGANGNKTGVYRIPTFWNYYDSATTISEKESYMWEANGSTSDQYDYELDSFQFSFLGVSGSFVVVRENGIGPLKAKLLGKNQRIKIEVDHDANFQLNKFTITDTNGNIYTFDKKEVLTSAPFTQLEFFDGNFTTTGQNQQIVSTNAWYLTKIESSNSKVLASFDYVTDYESFSSSYSWSNYEILNRGTNYYDMISDAGNAQILKPKNIYSYIQSSGNTQKLSKITFDRDGSSIHFGLGISHPETNGSSLGSITIKDKYNTEIKKYNLSYEVSANRLWLVNVEEQGGSLSHDYALEYNNKNNLPQFGSHSDDWGYNDGKTQIVVSNNDCSVTGTYDYDAITTGLLRKIIYPTGGVKEFIFEQNTISYQGDPNSSNGVTLTDDEYRELNPDNWDFEAYEMTYTGPAGTNILLTGSPGSTFTITQEQEIIFKRDISVSFTGSPGNVQEVLDNSYIELYDSTNTPQGKIFLSDSEYRLRLPAGTYTARFFSLTMNANFVINSCLAYNVYSATLSKFIYGGGVRIKEILFNDDNITSTPSRKISYYYEDAGDPDRSSGSVDGNLGSIVREYQLQTYPTLCTTSNTPRYKVTTKIPNIQMTQGSYVGYKTVRVSEYLNGSTVYMYTSAQDYASPRSVFQYPFAPAPTLDYKRGLLLKETVYAEPESQMLGPLGLKLKEIENVYEFEEDEEALNLALYSFEYNTKQFYDLYTAFSSGFPDNIQSIPCNPKPLASQADNTFPFYVISNPILSTWAKLKEKKVTDTFYDENDNPSVTESRQEFTYDPQNFQIKEQNTYFTEDGEDQHLKSIFYYPTSNGVYPTAGLLLINKLNEVLAVENYKNGQRTETIINTYKDFAPNLILPEKVQFAKAPIPPGDGSQYDLLVNLEDRIIYHDYDAYGNLLAVSKADGPHTSYIWGYSSTLPVAKIENATYSEIESLPEFPEGFTIQEELSSAQETDLRRLDNALVTTFTHEYLVGVTSITDPNGFETTFLYDDLNRLEYVKDKDEKVLSINKYNYKN